MVEPTCRATLPLDRLLTRTVSVNLRRGEARALQRAARYILRVSGAQSCRSSDEFAVTIQLIASGSLRTIETLAPGTIGPAFIRNGAPQCRPWKIEACGKAGLHPRPSCTHYQQDNHLPSVSTVSHGILLSDIGSIGQIYRTGTVSLDARCRNETNCSRRREKGEPQKSEALRMRLLRRGSSSRHSQILMGASPINFRYGWYQLGRAVMRGEWLQRVRNVKKVKSAIKVEYGNTPIRTPIPGVNKPLFDSFSCNWDSAKSAPKLTAQHESGHPREVYAL